VAVEQAVDEMQIAGSAAAGADCEAIGEMRLRAGRKCRDLLVADMEPFDLALAADRVRQAIEAVADNALDPLHARGRQRLGKLVCNRCHHRAP